MGESASVLSVLLLLSGFRRTYEVNTPLRMAARPGTGSYRTVGIPDVCHMRPDAHRCAHHIHHRQTRRY